MEEKALFKDHLLAVGKLNFARGDRPDVDCIFCAVRDDDPAVTALKVYQEDLLYICLNLYPYNPGHLMVVPTRHVEKFEDLTDKERNRLFQVVMDSQRMLADLFHPTGFNTGYNQGEYSGASIKHVHVHIVPRYKAELGYMDIIAGTKIVVQSVEEVLKTVKPRIANYITPIH
ncbi:MAG: HIT family protein [Promethearchaeota archaeon]